MDKDSYESLKNIFRFIRIWTGVVIILFYLFLFFLPHNNIILLNLANISAPLIGFIVLLVFDKMINWINEKKLKIPSVKGNGNLSIDKVQMLIGTIISIVYALAINKALETFSSNLKIDNIEYFKPNINEILMLIVFFATLIPFLHYVIASISWATKKEYYRFTYFILLFSIISASVFFFAASNLFQFFNFIVLLSITFTLTTIFYFLEYSIYRKIDVPILYNSSSTERDTYKVNIFFLNLITTFYLLYLVFSNTDIFMVSLEHINFSLILNLFLVLIARTILDYVFGWNNYKKWL